MSRQFARWIADLSYEELPAEVVDKIKAAVLLHLVGSVVGYRDPHARELVDTFAADVPQQRAATILCDGRKASRDDATIANCSIVHLGGLTDSFRMLTHPGRVLFPVAMVNAELEGSSVDDLVTALAAGYEVMCRLAEDFVPAVSAHGFRPAPVFATIGSAVVAGKLLGLGEDELMTALALGANCASGLNEGGRSGGDDTLVHDLSAARQGVFAARLATTSHVTGCESILEGESGFFKAFAGSSDGRVRYSFSNTLQVDLKSITEDLGTTYRLMGAIPKLYHISGYNQPVIELLRELIVDHHIAAADIANIKISLNYLETTYPSPAFPTFASQAVARPKSTQYYAAYVAVHGEFPVVGATGSHVGPVHDQAVLEFAASHVELVGAYEQPMFSPTINITCRDGSTFAGEYPCDRMGWSMRELAGRLAPAASAFPGGQRSFERLVDVVASTSGAGSVQALLDATLLG